MEVLAGPRQVGKTTLIRQVLEGLGFSNHYASADEPTLKDSSWLEQQWETGRLRAKKGQALLVLDEIQKVQKWPDLSKDALGSGYGISSPVKSCTAWFVASANSEGPHREFRRSI